MILASLLLLFCTGFPSVLLSLFSSKCRCHCYAALLLFIGALYDRTARLNSYSLDYQVKSIILPEEFVLIQLKRKEKTEEVPDDG